MRIAIVGGGASGLVAAYLLGKRHDVHLYECASYLGGHVRTLGQNIQVDNMPPGKVTENGPLAFHAETSPTLMRLLKELGISTESSALGTNLFLRANQAYFIRPDLKHGRRRFFEAGAGGWKTGMSLMQFVVTTRQSRAKRNSHKQLKEVFPHRSYLRDWLRCMIMMGLSTPIESVDSLPLPLTTSTLRQSLLHAEWKFIPGGVHSYQAELLSRFDGRLFLNSPVDKVFREKSGVRLSVKGKTTTPYDKLILATPPGRVLTMLEHPTAIEAKFFSKWGRDIPFRTIAHTDRTMYEDKSSARPSTADYFQRDEDNFGYNCCVSSHYYGTSEFSFSYNLDDLIDPAKRLDTHEHRIPAYSHAAMQYRQELIDTNGASHTYYAGAYLGNGLHEAAVSSANQVAHLLRARSRDSTKPS